MIKKRLKIIENHVSRGKKMSRKIFYVLVFFYILSINSEDKGMCPYWPTHKLKRGDREYNPEAQAEGITLTTDAKTPEQQEGIISFHKTSDSAALTAQPTKFKILFSGYIKPEAYIDSRQVRGWRNDQVLLFPERKLYDRCHHDLNAHPQLSSVAIETRLRAEIFGPKVWDSLCMGAIEADFWGTHQLDIQGFRLRHAFVTFDWGDKLLLFGQYWAPMFIPICAPDTISFDAGIPFDPYKRTPQLRFAKIFDPFEITFCASSEVNFVNDGPIGGSSTYLRNAVVPNMNVRLTATLGKTKDHYLGVDLDYRRIVPRLVTAQCLKTHESLNSFRFEAFASLNWPAFSIRSKVGFEQNATDYDSISGYAVHSINPVTDERTYTNFNAATTWVDFIKYYKTFEPGLFIGYIKSLGTNNSIIPCVKYNDTCGQEVCEKLIYSYGREDLDYVFRVTPRVRFYWKPVVLGAELEYTRAGWGTVNTRGKVDNVESVGNTRFLVALFYFF